MNEVLHTKDKSIAVPGEVLATGMGFLPSKGTYRDSDMIVCNRLGLVSIEGKVVKIVPLSGVYVPKLNDRIIGQVTDILMTGWRVDIRSPYSSVLSTKDAVTEFIARGADLSEYFSLGDYVVTKIVNITSQKLIDVTMKGPGLRKLKGGRIITVNSYKVPRIIGKDGSMVSMIKQASGCQVTVGQNGLIWIDGTPEGELVAVEAFRKIEAEAHLSGLTDKMKQWLTQRTGVQVEPRQEVQQ